MSIDELHQLFLKSSGVCTDSRKTIPGCIYISLKGERFDGNDYAVNALNDGAAYAIIDSELDVADERLIKVEDGLKCLQDLANHHRRYLDIPMLAITGSNGKTTTKELCGSVLERKYNLLITSGNFNNHIGVPLTLLTGNKQHELAVVEMGANHQGEIAELCRIAEPDVGLITNIGKAHLEGMGGIEGVLITKSELFNHLLDRDGDILLNSDEEKLMAFEGDASLIYGSDPDAAVYGEAISEVGNLRVDWRYDDVEFESQTNLVGTYNLGNVLSAIAAGVYFDVELEDIDEAISSYVPSNNRSEFQKVGSNSIVWDAYNANPTSMMAALENISVMDHGRKVLILGEMKEVGETSSEEHQNLVDEALKFNPSKLFLVGESFESCDRQGATWTSDVSTLKHLLEENPIHNSLILIKGSRSNKLEELKSVFEG